MPKVSIITATYNHARFLKQCLESVLAQTFRDWEQIIVDDGSTDDTPMVVASFSDPRLRYFRRERAGIFRLAETYNFALGQSLAPIIAILEGDDYWAPDFLASQVPILDDPSVVLAFAEISAIVADRPVQIAQPIRSWSEAERHNRPLGSALVPILSFNGQPQPMTWLVRRQALDAIGGFQQVPGVPTIDYPTVLRLALRGNFAYSQRTFAYWRKHVGQTTNKLSGAVFIGCADYASKFYHEELPNEIKRQLPLSAHELDRRLARQRAFGHFRQGRTALLANEWSNARASFREALAGSVYVKIAALAGWAASWLHLDLEIFARLLGKQWYVRAANGK